MKLTLFIIALLFSASSFAQLNVFVAPIPKKERHYSLALGSRIATISTDSAGYHIRPVVSSVYGYTKGTGSVLYTGAGAVFQHDIFKVKTQNYYTQYAVGPLLYIAGSKAPTNVLLSTAVGLQVFFLNKHVTGGWAYNFTLQTGMFLIGTAISLDN